MTGHASFSVIDHGNPDTSFSNDGFQTIAIGPANEFGYSVAIQPDGKILIAGQSNNGTNDDFTIVRLKSDGALDSSFNNIGIVQTPIGTGQDVGYAIAVQPDGKILLGGYSHNGSDRDFALVRYNSNGSLDTTFDSDGKVTTPIGSGNDYAYSIALQADGKILLGGRSHNGSDYDFAVVRYNSNGSLDTNFGSGGKVTTDITTNTDNGWALAVQHDGKILLGGYSDIGGGNFDFSLVRYNPDGSLDTTFDGDGKVTTAIGSGDDIAQCIAIQPDGKILLGGYWANGSGHNTNAVIRYNPNGSLDTGFGVSGKYTDALDVSYFDLMFLGITVRADGKILAAGSRSSFTDTDFWFVLMTADGSFQLGSIIDLGNKKDDYGTSIALQPDGMIVIGGYTSNGSNYDFAIARMLGTAIELKPSQFTFSDEDNAVMNTLQTSSNITIADLDTDVVVPVQVEGGEYAINAGDYTTAPGFVTNGDQVSVRHTSADTPETDTDSILTVGGQYPVNNLALILGDKTADTFTSTTRLLDVSIAMSGSTPANPDINTEISYSVYVSNSGTSPSAATGVSVEMQIDDQLLYKSSSGPLWNCSYSNHVLTCNYTDVIGVGASSGVLTVVATTPLSAFTAVNAASIITVDQTDSNLANNTTGNLNTVIGADNSDTTDTTDTTSTNSTSGGGGGAVNPLFSLLFCLLPAYRRVRVIRSE